MKPQQPGFFRRNATRLAAVALIVGPLRLRPPAHAAAGRARRPSPPASPSPASRSRRPAGDLDRTVRAGPPEPPATSASWISAVGAGVALNDLDGDGLPNDLCSVDPRIDQVLVAPVPGTGARYAPFVLDPAPLPYDARPWRRWAACPATSTRTARWTCWSTTGAGRRSLFLRRAGATALIRRRLPAGRAGRPASEIWNTNAADQRRPRRRRPLDLIVGNYFPDGMRMLDAQATDVAAHAPLDVARGQRRQEPAAALAAGRPPGPSRPSASPTSPDAFDAQTAYGWTLAVGRRRPRRRPAARALLRQRLRPRPPAAQPSRRPGHPRFARAGGAARPSPPRLEGARPRLVQGDGRRLRRPQRRRHPRHVRQQHRRRLRPRGEPLRLAEHRATSSRCDDGHRPLRRPRRDARAVAQRLGLGRPLADFDNDGVLEAVQAIGFLRGDDEPLARAAGAGHGQRRTPARSPRAGRASSPATTSRGHQPQPVLRARPRTAATTTSPPSSGWPTASVSRGIAIADVDGDGRLDFAVANQWEPSYVLPQRQPATGGFLGLRPAAARLARRRRPSRGRRRAPPRPPAIGAAATVRLPDGRRLVAQVDGGNGHSGKRSAELHFGLGRVAPGTPLAGRDRWRDATAVAASATDDRSVLAPGWHTVLLGRGPDEPADWTMRTGRHDDQAARRTCASPRSGGSPPPSRSSTSSATPCSASSSRGASRSSRCSPPTSSRSCSSSIDRAGSAAGPASWAAGTHASSTSCCPAHITGLAVAMLLYANDRLLPIVFAAAVGHRLEVPVPRAGSTARAGTSSIPRTSASRRRCSPSPGSASPRPTCSPRTCSGGWATGSCRPDHRLLGHVPEHACSPARCR